MASDSSRPVNWEALVNENENRLYRAAHAILGNPHEAEDAVQDTFLRCLEKPDAWLMRTLVNGCRSRLRLTWRKVGPLPDTLPVPGPEEREELEELFSLPPEGRTVLRLWAGRDSLSGSALYDSGGHLLAVSLRGVREQASFSLDPDPGHMPFSCSAYPDAAVTQVQDIPVTGWSRPDDSLAGSELMAHQVGVLFLATGDPAQTDPLEEACHRSTLFVRWMTGKDCPLTLDHLLQAEHVPEWRSADFTSLEEARQEPLFAPFLPETAPAGFGDFSGHLTFQEGNEHTLSVLWSRGYDDVRISVRLPEGDSVREITDAADPAAYDVRLCEIPWCDSVPEKYQQSISNPTFRAEDMSLAIVEARGVEKDTGGLRFSFDVLHPDGTLVSYSCSGVTAEYVWSLVRATL